MQAVILAAGKGTRMKELVADTPKPMLRVLGKPILEHKFEALPDAVDEVIIVVGYLGHIIEQHFGEEFLGRRVRYITQENPVGGTADALWKAQPILREKFIAMNGDDLYDKHDTETCLQYEWSMIVQKRDPLLSGGRVVVDDTNRVRDIVEGTHEGPGLINAGLYVLDTRFFSYPPVPKAPGYTEFGLPQTMLQAKDEIAIIAVPTQFWIQITSPEDIQTAEAFLQRR
jgi:D-glycero-alpha-D-manno-heptose 1-phosphate guanylyltransferase